MNISSPQILVLFILMGGVIAYLGDWLGRKMGKKRLRIAGLRPRHTATFFTVLMGMLIPVLTTYAILTISAPVRRWMSEGTSLVKERDSLQKQIGQYETNLSYLRSQYQLANLKLNQERQATAQIQNTNHSLQKRVAKVNGELSSSLRREASVQKRVAQLGRREKGLIASVYSKTQQLQKDFVVLQNNQREIKRLHGETDRMNQNSITVTQQIIDLEGQKKQAENDLNNAITAKNKALDDLQQADTEMQKAYDKLLVLRQTIMQTTQDLAKLRIGIEGARTSDVIYRKGEELGRIAVPSGLGAQAAEDKIGQLIKIADLAARERGVAPDASGRAAAMENIKRTLPDGSSITITVQDQVSAFVREITRANQDVVLIASSFYNYFAGEDQFVPLELNMFLNRVVYKAGDTVAETEIDGDASENEILDGIIQFLRTNVRVAAERAGMIPVHGQEASLGEISFEQMSILVRQIKFKRTKAKLVAIAAKTTKSAEPLSLKFKVQ